MALRLGELVGFIRADDSGWRAGLSSAELRLRGLQRSTDGTLRDLRGRFVSEGEAAGRGLSDGIRAHAQLAASALRKVAPAVAAIGAAAPAGAAVVTVLGAIAAGAVAAGLAVKAFSLAVGPQMEGVAEVAKLAEEAQKAAASGAADAAEKQKAYTDALAELPPATRATAKAFIGLKDDYKAWSDSLAPTTMPLVTRGIELLRSLLPSLTPFVRAAAGAFSSFFDDLEEGVRSDRFKEWVADTAAAAGPALRNFLTVLRNLVVGFAGVLHAFLPMSAGVTGGLVDMSAAFARWGTSLEDSEGFAEFLEMAREGGATLGQLAIAAGRLLIALGPLIGLTTQVALVLARVVNALPPGVLSALATAIVLVVVGMKAWAVGARVVAVANRLMAASTWTAIAGWLRMMAVGVLAYARIAKAAVLSAARTAAAWAGAALRSMAAFAAQVIRVAAVTIAQFVLMAARAVAWAAVMAAQWLIAMGPIGWVILAVTALVALVIAKWDLVKQYTVIAWTAVRTGVATAVQGVLAVVAWLGRVPGWILGWFTSAKNGAVGAMRSLVAWLAGLPGRVRSAISGLLGVLRGAATTGFNAFRSAASARVSSFLGWMRTLPSRISSAIGSLKDLLVGKGKDLVRGLMAGVRSMGGWLKSGLMSFAKRIIPGPIARALRIGSPSKLMADQIGRWIPPGILQGAEAEAPAMNKGLANLVTTPPPGQAGTAAGTRAGAPAAGGGRTVVELRSSGSRVDDMLLEILRDAVAVRGGDVQLVLGR
ncbi:hypothetical protein [Streptomyces sp. CC224B]|uniref:phage tail protein n=1 Tax=Streptomyces sp. CC224B TaxID=3044571 RepID=UPI0024A87A63|nr:hypothetical protein [Streptomyces sp. CC224B]